jgi:hypothetical protein
MKSLHLIGLIALAIAPMYGQPINGPIYWSPVATPPDCSDLNYPQPVAITNASGTTIGYSCYVSGTFVWFASGGMWGTTIRVAAPATNPIGVGYTFYDTTGAALNLDTTVNNSSSSLTSANEVDFALAANQPTELELLGATSAAPKYSSTATGSVYAQFYCPDEVTCEAVLPQLLYSALPADPWLVSVPMVFDGYASTTWSAVGINDSTHVMSLVICNEDVSATTYNVYVYDSSTGALVATGTTPSVPPEPLLADGSYGEGGTYGALLSDIKFSAPLPTGVIKVLIDGGTLYSGVVMLQVTGLPGGTQTAATSLQVAYDSSPTTATSAVPIRRKSARRFRVPPTPKTVFPALPK